jgi:hypothetical protein
MQVNPFQRRWWGVFSHVCVGGCWLWAGALHAAERVPSTPSLKSSQDIAAELDRETDLSSQLDRTLGPMSLALKQAAAGAHRIKTHVAAGTPEDHQARELYARVRQAVAQLERELTEAVQTVKPQDRGERAGQANKRVTADLNEAVQSFNDFATRLVPAPPSEPPKGPAQPAPAGEPAGQPTPPGFSMQSVQPEQYIQAQQPGVSADVVVQVCNVFVVHVLGLSDKSVESTRQQVIRQIRSHALLPAFEGA